MKKFTNTNRWFQGPEFLWKPQSSLETSSDPVSMQPEEPELKKQVKINKITVEDDLLGTIEEKYFCWLIMLVLKWKINTGRKKEMMPKKVLDFPHSNISLLNVKLFQETEMFCEDIANKIIQCRTEVVEDEKRRKYKSVAKSAA